MNKKTFAEYFQSRRYKVLGSAAFGVENDYPVAVVLVQNQLLSVTFSVSAEETKTIAKELRKELKARFGKKAGVSHQKGTLNVTLGVKKKEYDSDYCEVMSGVTQWLNEKGVMPVSTCSVCGQGDCDAFVAVDGYTPIHKRCLDGMVSKVHQSVEANDINGNYATGIIGAILGAIVGFLPSLLTVILNDTIYAVLFALIPICIYQGYKLCKGKMNKVVIVIAIILTVISVYLLIFTLMVYQIVAEYMIPFDVAVGLMLEMLAFAETWVEVTAEAWVYFVFAALGIWFAWGKITQTGATDIKSMEDLMSTVVDAPVSGN